MTRMQTPVALLCAALTLSPVIGAQTASAPDPKAQQVPADNSPASQVPVIEPPRNHRFSAITRAYEGRVVPPIALSNTSRMESLLRAGQLYLSVQDAIALALENNLDIEIQRYGPLIAEQDLLRAKAGGLLRGVPQSVTSGAQSAGQGAVGGNALGANNGGGTNSVAAVNGVISQIGPSTPNLDPALAGQISWGHRTSLLTSGFTTGSNSITSGNKIANFQLSQGFLTGTNATLGYANTFLTQPSFRNDINPSTQADLEIQVTQHLLQGFGLAVNNRNIRIARNQVTISDSVFRQQVITTVASIITLYYDLVSYNQDALVKRQALSLSEKLYSDNKKQVEIGTLAPIEIVRAEAEVASRQQDLTISETQVLQQETILKNALSRTGVASPSIADARIVTLDKIRLPETEAVQPVQDLVARALDNRPEIEQSRLSVENSRISLKGSRNGLLPTVDAFVDLRNNALAGTLNSLPVPTGAGGVGVVRNPADYSNVPLIGGYGSVLGQLFGRNYPDYSAGFQLNIPIRNRAAQADYIRDQLNLRQSELRLQQAINQIRVDVQNSLVAVRQARSRYEAAQKSRVLQEQTLDAEQKKYALGASTIFLVIQAQRDLAVAQSSEVTALSNYSRARVGLEQSVGDTLANNGVNIDEALRGHVSRVPSQLPVLDRP